MKYLLACLIVIAVPILLMAVFGLGALCYGVSNLMKGMWQLKEEE
jgi:hypothetical protein